MTESPSGGTERFSSAYVAGLGAGALLVLVAFASAWLPGGTPRWGVWCMITGSALVLSSMLALGALRSDVPRSRVTLLAAFLLVVIVGGFGLPLALPADTPDGMLVLGLPLRVAIEIFGVGLLPGLVLPVAFAIHFRAAGLDRAALSSLRERAHAARRNDKLPADS